MERDELDELIKTLNDQLRAGNVRLSSEHTVAALRKVRMAEDGKVDPATVDGSVRALAMAVAASKAQREMEQIPLRDVQSKYFDILETNFGRPFSEMTRKGLTPQLVADDLASNSRMVTTFHADVPEFTSAIKDFWMTFGPVVSLHLNDLKCLKSVFGGDVFPSYASNVARSAGLYMDTRLDELQNERETEPERIRALYEVKAHRVEPIGLVYLWPVTN